MTAVFADSYYYMALLNAKDPAHEKAKKHSRKDVRPVVTTRWILTEVADGMAHRDGRQLIVPLFKTLETLPKTRILPFADDLYLSGLDLYGRRPDKEWSLTDCISFVVMEREGMTDALTADRHFEQAGFVALLR